MQPRSVRSASGLVQAAFEKAMERKGVTSFDLTKMARLLDHDNHDTRDGLKKLFREPLYTPRYNLSLDEERDLAYKR